MYKFISKTKYAVTPYICAPINIQSSFLLKKMGDDFKVVQCPLGNPQFQNITFNQK